MNTRTGVLSIKGHALTFDDGDPTSVATALASTMCDPTGLVRMGFARLSTEREEPRYRYEVTNGVMSASSASAGTYREFHRGRLAAFVEEYAHVSA